MKWVKCIRNDYYLNDGLIYLEVGKIYKVLKSQYIFKDKPITITIKDKSGFNTYLIKDNITNITFFEDATAEVRDKKLNDLGI